MRCGNGGDLTVSAASLLHLLRHKHQGDLFVSECKTGPTHVGQPFRFDAWVMKRSWAHPEYTGYEIKVTRSDFLRDEKWRAYLPFCNRLLFVSPLGVIKPEELPDSVGLLVPAPSGNKLLTKKKAIYRQVPEPVAVLLYILMSRAKIHSPTEYEAPNRSERTAFWRAWLEEKQSADRVGHLVSRELRVRICGELGQALERAREAEFARDAAVRRADDLERIAAILNGMGISDWQLRDIKDQMSLESILGRRGLSLGNFRRVLEGVQRDIASIIDRIGESDESDPINGAGSTST